MKEKLLSKLMALIEEEFHSKNFYTAEDTKKLEELRKIKEQESDITKLATEGSDTARQFVKNKIYFILNNKKDLVNDNNIDSIIKEYHIDYYKNIFTANDDTLLQNPIDKEIEEYMEKYTISTYDSFDEKLQKLSQIIYQEVYGYSIIDELVFESGLNEVACNRRDYIWIQYEGIKRRIPNSKFLFENEDLYSKIIQDRIVATAMSEMNKGCPEVRCILRNGSRVEALQPPLSKYFKVNIRLFKERDERYSIFPKKIERIIEILAKYARRNVCIIGGMGAGKSTALEDLIIRNLDDSIAIGLAETEHELGIGDKYPNKNVTELAYGNIFEPSSITETFFRCNCDIQMYGEVRAPKEAVEVIKAGLRMERGTGFSFHTSNIQRTIHNLRQLLMQSGHYSDYREAQYDVADALDLIIHIKVDRSTGERIGFRVAEVIPILENMSFEIRDIAVYDKETKKYRINKEGVHPETIKSGIEEYELTRALADELRELFKINDDEKSRFDFLAN